MIDKHARAVALKKCNATIDRAVATGKFAAAEAASWRRCAEVGDPAATASAVAIMADNREVARANAAATATPTATAATPTPTPQPAAEPGRAHALPKGLFGAMVPDEGGAVLLGGGGAGWPEVGS